jgi:hypothetical protein
MNNRRETLIIKKRLISKSGTAFVLGNDKIVDLKFVMAGIESGVIVNAVCVRKEDKIYIRAKKGF